ncbi:hypothetical protein N806_29785 [Rhodococcus sp. P27]|nr:hypothetical protein N806_29785 [Rhodococcus sp. P27]
MNELRDVTVILTDDTVARFEHANVMLDPAEGTLTVYGEEAMYTTFNWDHVALYSVGRVSE